MPRYLTIILISIMLSSCSDGDVIVSNFDFMGQSVNLCRTAKVGDTSNVKYVFSKINNDAREALAVEFVTRDSILTRASGKAPYMIKISGGDSKVSYRRFNGDIKENYFCNAIPPGKPQVIEEYLSTEGSVGVTTQGIPLDEDGIPEDVERFYRINDTLTDDQARDFDGDGIPNVYDFDDDGDNVPTSNEGAILNDDKTAIDFEASQDTDNDGIPDFLDVDDDNDGVLTRNEDKNGDLDPRNDVTDPDKGPDYLNVAVRTDYTINAYIPHIYYLTNVKVSIFLNNLVFENTAADDVIRQESLDFETYDASRSRITVKPKFNK